MKRIIAMAMLLMAAAAPLKAQRLVVGERAPELKVQKWLTAAPSTDGQAVMVEFFHSSNRGSADRLQQLNSIANANKGKMVVVVITRENDAAVTSMLTGGNPAYYVGYDDGTTSTAFCARVLPHAVIYDKRGRILWLGNPTSLTNEDIARLIN